MTEKQLKNFLRNNNMFVAYSNAAFVMGDLYYKAYTKCKSVTGRNLNPIFAYFNRGLFYQINSEKQMVEISKINYEKYCQNPKHLDTKIAEHIKASGRVEKAFNEYKGKSELNDKELLRLYKKITKLWIEYIKHDAFGEDKGKFIEDNILPKLRSDFGLSDLKNNEVINILAHPEKQAVFNLEKIDFLNLCFNIVKDKELKKAVGKLDIKEIKKDKKIAKLICQYIEKYFWKDTDFYKAEKINFKSVIKDIRSYIKKNNIVNIKKERDMVISGHKDILRKKAKINKKIKSKKEQKRDIYYISRISAWIDIRKHLMMKNIYYVFVILEDIFKRRSIKWDVGSLLAQEEIIRLFETKEKISGILISKRKKEFIAIYETGLKTKILYGAKAAELFKLAKGESGSEIIKGMVASRGKKDKIIGVARIVFNPYKDKFIKGEILVTSMTRIEYVPLMRKALGIITNEGGIASHAAVISREFGLPCIIGTKNATDKIKSGDRVEMDLVNREIKIIK